MVRASLWARAMIVFLWPRRMTRLSLVPHEGEQGAIREMVALKAEGRPLRAIAAAYRKRAARAVADSVRETI